MGGDEPAIGVREAPVEAVAGPGKGGDLTLGGGERVHVRQGQTYLEGFVEQCGALPYEVQRALATIRDLDERMTEVRERIEEKTAMCLELPSQSSRFVTREQAGEIIALRKEVERDQKLAELLCNEKIQLAMVTYDLLDAHLTRCDKNIIQFEHELKVSGALEEARRAEEEAREGEHSGEAPPGSSHPSHRGGDQHPSSRQVERKNTKGDRGGDKEKEALPPSLKAGTFVAAYVDVSVGNGGVDSQWILSSVRSMSRDRSEVVVADEYEAEAVEYRVDIDNVVVLPEKNTSARALPAGTRSLALYPETSVFYAATVVSSARRGKNGNFNYYTVEFDDDADPGCAVPQRQVLFMHVLPLPKGR